MAEPYIGNGKCLGAHVQDLGSNAGDLAVGQVIKTVAVAPAATVDELLAVLRGLVEEVHPEETAAHTDLGVKVAVFWWKGGKEINTHSTEKVWMMDRVSMRNRDG